MSILGKPNKGEWQLKSGPFGSFNTPVPDSLFMMEEGAGILINGGLDAPLFNSDTNPVPHAGDSATGDSYLDFTAVDDLNVDWFSTFGITSYPFTVAVIFRSTDGGQIEDVGVFGVGNDNVNNQYYHLEIIAANRGRNVRRNTTAQNNNLSVAVNANQWRLLTCTFEDDANAVAQDDEEYEGDPANSVTFTSNTNFAVLGCRPRGTRQDFMQGDIACAMVWKDVALSEDQILTDMWNSGIPWDFLEGFSTAPILTNPLDSGTGVNTSVGVVTSNTTGDVVSAVVTQSAVTPTHDQIVAGEDHTGAPADAADTTPGLVGANNLSFIGLAGATQYFTHFTQGGAIEADPVSADGFVTSTSNEPPQLDTPEPDQIVQTGVPYSNDISGNFSDPDGDPLLFTAEGLPKGLTISEAGVISGTPTGGFEDLDAPLLTFPTDDAIGAFTSEGSVDTDREFGTIYAVVTQSATTPTSLQIIQGQDEFGNPADASANDPATNSLNNDGIAVLGTNTLMFAGLLENTAYFTHFTQDDEVSIGVIPVSANGFTTNASAVAPVLTNPVDDSNLAEDSTGSVTSDVADGTVVYGVVTQSAVTPTHAQIVAGEDDLGNPADSNDAVLASIGVNNLNFSGLVQTTAYFTHFAQQGAINATPVSADGFTTDSPIMIAGTDGANHIGYNGNAPVTGSLIPDVTNNDIQVAAITTDDPSDSIFITFRGFHTDDDSTWERVLINGTFADGFTGEIDVPRSARTSFIAVGDTVWTFFDVTSGRTLVDGNTYTVTWV